MYDKIISNLRIGKSVVTLTVGGYSTVLFFRESDCRTIIFTDPSVYNEADYVYGDNIGKNSAIILARKFINKGHFNMGELFPPSFYSEK